MFLIIVLGELVVQIPMPVLVGIMIMVCIGTFDWSSFKYLVRAPRTDAIVMVVTVIIVVATHDLSKGVIAGVILSAVFFAAKISHVKVTKELTENEHKYSVQGQVFFASVDSFVAAFDTSEQNKKVSIDFSQARVWDDSAVGAIDKVVLKLRENNNTVSIIGLDSASKKLVDKLAIFQDPDANPSGH